jgi:ADP-ribosyl-[dinitrogen reductase] hydrolase
MDFLLDTEKLSKRMWPTRGHRNAMVEFSVFSDKTDLDARRDLLKRSIEDPTVDRVVGSITGMAFGDAVGAPLEFLKVTGRRNPRHYFDLATNSYVGELNEFDLEKGQWTDDASMGLCMADSLLARKGYDGSDIRGRFWHWWNRGYNNAFRFDRDRADRHSVGLGGNISKSLERLDLDEAPPEVFASPGSEDAGNGSIMRLAPVPIAYHYLPKEACDYSERSSLTTHPGRLAAACCRLLASIIVAAINRPADDLTAIRHFLDGVLASYADEHRDEPEEIYRLLRSKEGPDSRELCWNWRSDHLDFAGTMRNRGKRYNGYPVSAGYFGSFCIDAMSMALHSVYNTSDPNSAVERCVNMLGDADSTGSVTGQIAGAFYGYSRFDGRILDQLHQWDRYEIPLRGVLLERLARSLMGREQEGGNRFSLQESYRYKYLKYRGKYLRLISQGLGKVDGF